ncbi:MAG: gamma-glutamylcyclotransferase [Deltaproteobacteria bacterium]|nr:gamma-glutamylcyclotransferase [Deltaproteobacteria bacterium]
MNYFAYGSNMNLDQMRYRCPGAKKIGNGHLNSYEICFPRKSSSRQGKGVASICEKASSYVEGVVFELTSADWNSLDRYEDVPDSYTRKLVIVSMNDGKEIEAETYTAIPMEGYPFKPSKPYMDLIIHGAEENGLSRDYIEKLKNIEFE